MKEKLKTISNKLLSKIGIGSYGIGGKAHRYDDLKNNIEDSIYTKAITHQLNSGMNFVEISIAYAHGKSAELIHKGTQNSNITREDLFITNSLYPKDLNNFKDIYNDIDSMHKLFKTEVFDSTLITLSLIKKYGYKIVIELIKELIHTARTRSVTLSNSNLAMIKKLKTEFGNLFFAHEGHISFEIREVKDIGIFDLCRELRIENIIWRPFRQGKTFQHNWNLITNLSEKYNKTQAQIILNWIVYLGYRPRTMSKSIKHINENIKAIEFQMTKEDYNSITRFRVNGYRKPKVDWDKTGDGISVSLLPDLFEKNYKSEIQ